MAHSRCLDGKVVVVTGAGGGIGRHIALAAASEGAKVVVNDLGGSVRGGEAGDSGPAESVAAEIREQDGEAIANTDSVADWNGAQNIIAAALDHFGRIDGVVNNAGNLRDKIFHKMEEADFDTVIAVHLKGCFNVSRAAVPHMKAQESGAFVHMTSTSGLIGNFGQANYCAAKMGIVGLSKSIALDTQKFNLRSNCIAPFALTRMIQTMPTGEDSAENAAYMEKLKKMEADRVAPLAVSLLADEAADVSGQIFGVRANEIYLFTQPRPLRSMHHGKGWTPASVLDAVLPGLRPSMYPLDRSRDVFSWDPI